MRESKGDKAFNITINFLVVVLIVLLVYPLYFVVIASFSNRI